MLNKQVLIKLVFIFIFIIAVFVLYKSANFKQYSSSLYYEIEDDIGLKNIDIQLDNVTLNVIPTNNQYIKLSRDTIFRRYNHIEYSSSYTNNTLSIKKFVKTRVNKEAKDILTVEIPFNSKIENVNIVANNSEINIEGANIKNLNVSSSEYLDLNIQNTTLQDVKVNSKKLDSKITSSQILGGIEYDIESGNIVNDTVVGEVETISNVLTTTYKNIDTRFKTTSLTSSNVLMSFKLSNSVSYVFNDTVMENIPKQITQDDGTYYYNEKNTDLPKYIVEANGNRLIELEIKLKEAVGSEDVK